MSSIKDQYIHEVTIHIDNPILKRRLKKELEAHFDDALALEKNNSEETEERIKGDLGDPEEIAHIANEGHVSILTFLKRNTKRGIFSALVLILCIFSIGMVYVFDRLKDTENQLALMEKEITKLQQEVTRIDLLDEKISDLQYNASIAFDLAVLYHSDSGTGTLVKTVLNPLNSTSPNKDVTALVPKGLPIVMTFRGKIPSDIVIRELFGQMTFYVKTATGEVPFCRYKIYSSTTITQIRSEVKGSVELSEGDLRLTDGLFLIRTIYPFLQESQMTSDQYTQAETLIKNDLTLIAITPFPVIISSH